MKLLQKPYFRLTRTATYSFIAILPLLLLYETLIILASPAREAAVRIGAEVWMKQLLAMLGLTGHLVLGLLVLVVGVGILFYERKKHIPLRPHYFGWMLLESAVLALLLAFVIAMTVGLIFFGMQLLSHLFQAEGIFAEGNTLLLIALSLGAGLYEELLFRVILVGGLYWLFARILKRGASPYVIAAVLGAALFSAVHYIGPLGDPFTLASFTFRFLFGLALNGLFLLRGFGIAAWTHALYDVMVVTRMLA